MGEHNRAQQSTQWFIIYKYIIFDEKTLKVLKILYFFPVERQKVEEHPDS
jgi:hypothetical protein